MQRFQRSFLWWTASSFGVIAIAVDFHDGTTWTLQSALENGTSPYKTYSTCNHFSAVTVTVVVGSSSQPAVKIFNPPDHRRDSDMDVGRIFGGWRTEVN